MPRTGSFDSATVAYDAATGANQGVKRYDGRGHGADFAAAVSVSPDGFRVFVTGSSAGSSAVDFATVAHEGRPGSEPSGPARRSALRPE